MKAVDRVKADFYQWIQKDVRRELSSDLHLLRQVKGTLGIRACHYFDSLDNSECIASLEALSKKFLMHNEDAVGQKIDEADKKRWHSCEEAIFVHPIKPGYLDCFYTEAALRARKSFNFRLLRDEIRNACRPYLGKPNYSRGKVFSYETSIEGFVVTTEFDLGGWSQLRYLHSVQYDDGISANRHRVIMTDFLRWLGLGETSWEFMTNEDIPNVAVVIGDLCRNFVQGIEPILYSSVRLGDLTD